MKYSNLKLDDPIIMITPTDDEFNCHFAGDYDKDGFPLVWIGGNTSWTLMKHPIKHFKPSSGWSDWKIPESKQTFIYEVVCYGYYEESFVVTRHFNKKDAYRTIIKLRYDWWQEWQNDRLLYGKDTLPDSESFYYVNKVEVF